MLGPGSAEKRGAECPLLGTEASSGHLRLVLACGPWGVEAGIRGDVAYATLPGRDDLEVVSRTRKR